ERSVNRGTDYRIFITSREGQAKRGEVGSVHDRFPLSGGGEDVVWDRVEVAWTADCRMVSLWIGGEIRGAWDVRGAWDMRYGGELDLGRISYRIAPPRGTEPLSLSKMVQGDRAHGVGLLIDA